ncbi:hypothetical protein AJ79_05043 [Helicocarpus griseus UAMH5409]|uniref:F-box domain-containing protein n=1 Tax=Helicocarpus griseus UAMH5409 TaxID=1447875 RepID=A0A2B7XR09_9EURO|nr:hypothetical protein AJ79_05043 [Helicocarpus griseus UAMH5409]
MVRFPQELVSNIVDYLIDDDSSQLISYATISREWQYAVERINLNRLKFESTKLSKFANLFRPSQSHRRTLVKVVYYCIVLPAYNDEACGKYENENEKEANSQVFSEALYALFKVLKALDDEKVRSGGEMVLILEPYSSTDTHRRPKNSNRKKDLGIKRYQASFLQIKNPERLPLLSNIITFYSQEDYHTRNVEPASAIAIASKLRNLKECYVEFSDREFLSAALRRTNRYNLAQALSAYPQSVDDIRIKLHCKNPEDEGSAPPNLLPSPSPSSSSPTDPLNLALHDFIQKANVGKIVLEDHLVTPELFWPPSNTTAISDSSSFWQNLREIQVHMQVSTPDGGWYFMNDPSIASYAEFTGVEMDIDDSSEDAEAEWDETSSSSELDYSLTGNDTEKNTFRSIPDPERMNPLLITMARAAHHAPVLERMWLKVNNESLRPSYLEEDVDISRSFEVFYVAKGAVDHNEEAPDDEKARLIWQVGDWRPDQEVERHWSNALSPEGAMIYNDPNY